MLFFLRQSGQATVVLLFTAVFNRPGSKPAWAKLDSMMRGVFCWLNLGDCPSPVFIFLKAMVRTEITAGFPQDGFLPCGV